jgi:uncharacterized glyoxalase superfamily protein PhnB
VTPWIVTDDSAAMIDYLRDAFGGEELGRVHDEAGRIGHAEVRIGDSVVMLFDRHDGWPATAALLRLYVEDGDETFRRALAAGGTAVTALTELSWGDRVGRIRDPLGNLWWIQAPGPSLTPDEMAARASDPRFAEAMRHVQQTLDDALRG